MTVTIPIRGLLTDLVNVGTIIVYLIGRKQQDAVDHADRNNTVLRWKWEGPYHSKYSFVGTPAEYTRFLGTQESMIQHNPNSTFDL